MRTVLLEIIAPDKVIFKGEIRSLQCRAEEGELGVLPGHADLLAHVKEGEVRIVDAAGAAKVIELGGGFMEVHPDRIVILAG